MVNAGFAAGPGLSNVSASTLLGRRPQNSVCGRAHCARASQWSMTLRTAVLLSGGGRSLENLAEKIESGAMTGVEISCVIASKPTAGGLARAERRGIPTSVVRSKDFDSKESMSAAVSEILDAAKVDLVVLAGWLHFYLIPERYNMKVINIHPSLIPAFCGAGCYGDRVHSAVLDYGAKISGCTVHFADNEYDNGPIILQRAVAVKDNDTTDALAARVFEEEKIALPEAVQAFADKRIRTNGRIVSILGKGPEK